MSKLSTHLNKVYAYVAILIIIQAKEKHVVSLMLKVITYNAYINNYMAFPSF